MKAFHEIRSYSSDIMIWHRAFKNISFLAHWHQEIELIYMRSGSAEISVMDHTFTANEGDFIICDSGEIHFSDSHGRENCMDFIVFDPTLISSIYDGSHFIHPLISKTDLEAYHLTEPLGRMIATIDYELAEKKAYYQDVIKASLREFWYLLKRNLPTCTVKNSEDKKKVHYLQDFQLLLSELEDRYAENIDLEYAASRMNFSPSYFSRLFKKLTGTHFISYLNTIRVEQAASMIRNSDQRMTDIAFQCGFNNIRSFNRVFKDTTGHTPSEFLTLPGTDVESMSCFNRKSHAMSFVENDPVTVIKNS